MSSALFSPLQLRNLTLPNRVIISPMCQYSATDGCASDWHLMHIGQFAVSGSGMMIVEMTNVEARGRISPYCLGLYNDATEAALARVMDFCKQYGNTPMAVQLAHAGRKASTQPPWLAREPLTPTNGGWQSVAPSAIAMDDNSLVPQALTRAEIDGLVESFALSARRAERIGFEAIELHGAHGYLLHQFLSPLSNQREDDYGGSLENRLRLLLEVYDAVRSEVRNDMPVGVRVSATDWIDGGWSPEETVQLAAMLKARGCDWLDVSSGGLVAADIPLKPGYQVPFAQQVKQETGITTMSVGLITEPQQAEDIIASGQADMVALARGMLYDPRWTWHAAVALGAQATYPKQYLRCQPQATA